MMMRLIRGTALVVFNSLVLLGLLNVLLYLVWGPAKPEPWFVILSKRPYTAQELEAAIDWFVAHHVWDRLQRFYPQLDDRQIARLMIETYRPLLYEPFTQFRERPIRGQYVNVDLRGFRIGSGQGPWPPSKDTLNVFVFGGSTTFGVSVADDATVPSQLQAILTERLDTPVHVYNFGRGYYFSTQERILFEQLLVGGFVPDVAIFIDGLNDYYFPYGEPALTRELRRFVDLPEEPRHPLFEWINELPLGQAAARIRWGAIDEPSAVLPKPSRVRPEESEERIPDPIRVKLAASVQQRWLANKRIIEAVASAFGVQPVLVWQPVPKYKYDRRLYRSLLADRHDPNALSGVYGYPEMAKLHERGVLADDFIWCADIAAHSQDEVYLDEVHYTPQMSRRLAHCIAKGMLRRHLLGHRPREAVDQGD